MPRQYDPSRPLSPKSYLKTISLIYLALLVGEILFCLVSLAIEPQRGISYDTKDPFVLIVPGLAIAAFIASIFVFKKQVTTAKQNPFLKEKLMAYQAAMIQRFVFLEGASKFTIVTYLISGNLLFIIIGGLLFLCFLTLRPTKDKIANDLELSYEDKVNFESEDTVL